MSPGEQRNLFLENPLCSALLSKLALKSTHCWFLRFVGMLMGKLPVHCVRCLGCISYVSSE